MSSNADYVLLLEPSGPDGEALANAVRQRGYRVLEARDDGSAGGRSAGGPDVFTAPFGDEQLALELLLKKCRGLRVSGVSTTREFLTPLATRVSASLGLPGNDPSRARHVRSKVLMAEALEEAGVPTPDTCVLQPGEPAPSASSQGLPVVVKPAEQAGSVGVSVVFQTDEMAPATQRAATDPELAPYGLELDARVLVQSLVPGEEFSVESVTQCGVARHVSVTRKVVTEGVFRVEIGHNTPAALAPRMRRRVEDTTTEALRTLGVHNSVSHTEVMVGPDGDCTVLEVASRLGAGRIGQLVQLALGVDLYGAAVDVAVGRPVQLQPSRGRVAASRLFLTEHSGTLRAVHGLPVLSEELVDVAVTKTAGVAVGGPDSSKGRVGHFILVGDHENRVVERAADLLARVRVEVDRV